MSQSSVYKSPCEDNKYAIDIKEESLDASAVTDIDTIKHDSCLFKIKDEIDSKDEPLERTDGYIFDLELRSPNHLKQDSSHMKVCLAKKLSYNLQLRLLCVL